MCTWYRLLLRVVRCWVRILHNGQMQHLQMVQTILLKCKLRPWRPDQTYPFSSTTIIINGCCCCWCWSLPALFAGGLPLSMSVSLFTTEWNIFPNPARIINCLITFIDELEEISNYVKYLYFMADRKFYWQFRRSWIQNRNFILVNYWFNWNQFIKLFDFVISLYRSCIIFMLWENKQLN